MIIDQKEWLNADKDESYRMFTIICDRICSEHHPDFTGWTQIKLRLSDMTSEGEALFIETTDNLNEKEGNFDFVELNKEELKKFIEYLNWCYEQFPKESKD